MAPKKGAKRVTKERTPVSLADLTGSARVVEGKEAMVAARPTRGATRDDAQRQIDALTLQGYHAWEDAGEPKLWVDQPGIGVTVPLDAVETVQWMARKSGTMYGVRIRFGDLLTESDVDGNLIPEGYGQVVWTATDRPVKADGTPEDSEEAAADSDLDGSDEGEPEA